MGKIITTLKIDEELWKKVKHYAIDNKTSVTKLIEKLLREEIEKKQGEKK